MCDAHVLCASVCARRFELGVYYMFVCELFRHVHDVCVWVCFEKKGLFKIYPLK